MDTDVPQCVCEGDTQGVAVRSRFVPSDRSLLGAMAALAVGLALALLGELPQPAKSLSVGGLAASAIAMVAVSGAARMRRGDVALDPRDVGEAIRAGDWDRLTALHDDCPSVAAVIAACRSLASELTEREATLRQMRTGAVEQQRLLVEQIGEHERDSERLRYLAQFDTLTSLPNRWLFLERLERAIGEARVHGCDLAVLAIEVDGLHKVNGSLGHRVGDKLLETTASRLEECLRHHDTVARWGGNEFVVMLPRLAWTTDADIVARKLLATIAQPLEIDGYVLNVTATIGIAVFPGDGLDEESLVQHASSALHRARREGTNRFESYSSSTAVAAPSPFLESGLRRAIERSEFVLHYQPMLRLDAWRVTGAEALIRWEHPHLGTLPPACFITLAEEMGAIIPLTTWALREACAQLARWDVQGLTIGRLAVNISAHQLREANFVDTITRIVGEAGIDPERIELEVTESVLVADDRCSVETLQLLKMRGFRIAIDDFGTGYSSLSYLQRLPVDRLKIDRTFVRDLGESEHSAAIVEMILTVARRLGLRVTAEGVETMAQLEFLRAHGCDEIQGYYLGQPGPPSTIESAIRAIDLDPREKGTPCSTTS